MRGCTTGAAKPTGQTSSVLHIMNILFTDHITIAIVAQTHNILSAVQLLPDLLSSVHDASTSNSSIKIFTKISSFGPTNHPTNLSTTNPMSSGHKNPLLVLTIMTNITRANQPIYHHHAHHHPLQSLNQPTAPLYDCHRATKWEIPKWNQFI